LIKRKLKRFARDLYKVFKVKVKVKVTLKLTTKAQRGRRYIAVLFLQPLG
jgi:hypothetical protein